jgi:hypothetical protein
MGETKYATDFRVEKLKAYNFLKNILAGWTQLVIMCQFRVILCEGILGIHYVFCDSFVQAIDSQIESLYNLFVLIYEAN